MEEWKEGEPAYTAPVSTIRLTRRVQPNGKGGNNGYTAPGSTIGSNPVKNVHPNANDYPGVQHKQIVHSS